MLAVLVVLRLLPDAAVAADTITRVEVTGNRTVAPEAIRTHVKLGKSNTYTPAQVDEALKSLFATGLFSNVQIDRRGTTLVINVTENPVIASVAFEGNTNADKTKIEPLIQQKAGARYTPAKVHADALKVRDYYRSQGRQTTEVNPKATTAQTAKSKLSSPSRRARSRRSIALFLSATALSANASCAMSSPRASPAGSTF